MTQSNTPSNPPPDKQASENQAPQTPAGDAAPPDQQVATLQTELDDLQQRLLRVSADYQNYVKRTQQNLSEAQQYQTMQVARALLPVLDHFDRALEVDPNSSSAASLLQGMQILRTDLLKALDGFGVRPMTVNVGEAFDPQRHEALMRQPVEGMKSNHIAAVFQGGYTFGEKTLRPAKVSVTPE